MTDPTLSPWYRWPEDRMRGMLPWWTILRRLVFYPFLLVGVCLAFVAIVGGFGLDDAKSFWKKV